MDARQLEIFVKVAELGSFSKAAEALFLTQPTVSEHIRGLEEELGVRLLDRLGRGAAPTKAGQLLLGYGRRILELHREARQALDQFQGRMSGELVIAASTIPGEYVLPALIGRFKEKYPDIAISLLIGDTQRVVEWVLEGRAELAVAGAQIDHRALEYRELMPDELVLVVSAAHPWHGKKTATLEEVRAEPLIVRERGSGSRHALEKALAEVGLDLSDFRVVGEMGSTQAIKQGVKAGVGISLISKRAVAEECQHGTLHCVKVKDLRFSRAFYLVTSTTRSRSPLAEAFRAFLISESA
ncbi:MAG: LysR family transcriptional regulator [Candidatus Rokubacteria bacterium RIFCSPLOWO2_12_FULL_69_21]|jgi:DNA-binding transcriptional LysR family regulator|nr:MAG: LysR family transcriptional regulator [Candidatus Rokubacteria bacterium RIFCSPLOWO2_12_FULL_69_21]